MRATTRFSREIDVTLGALLGSRRRMMPRDDVVHDKLYSNGEPRPGGARSFRLASVSRLSVKVTVELTTRRDRTSIAIATL